MATMEIGQRALGCGARRRRFCARVALYGDTTGCGCTAAGRAGLLGHRQAQRRYGGKA